MDSEAIFVYNSLVKRFSSRGRRPNPDMKYLFLGYASGWKTFQDILNYFIGEPSLGDEKEFRRHTFLNAVRRINGHCDLIPLEDDIDKLVDVKKLVVSYAAKEIEFEEFHRQLRNLEVVDTLI